MMQASVLRRARIPDWGEDLQALQANLPRRYVPCTPGMLLLLLNRFPWSLDTYGPSSSAGE